MQKGNYSHPDSQSTGAAAKDFFTTFEIDTQGPGIASQAAGSHERSMGGLLRFDGEIGRMDLIGAMTGRDAHGDESTVVAGDSRKLCAAHSSARRRQRHLKLPRGRPPVRRCRGGRDPLGDIVQQRERFALRSQPVPS